MEPKKIKISKIEGNTGQIEGLPRNPRFWSPDEVEQLANSIEQTPELMEARPLILVPFGAKYVALGGNMRLAALKKLGRKETTAYILENLTTDQMKAIVIKDNGSYGDWDIDELANKWDLLPLDQWGVNIPGLQESTTEYEGKNSEIDTSDWNEDMVMKFKFKPEESDFVNAQFNGKDARIEILKLLDYGE